MAQVRVVLKSVFDDKGLKEAQSGFAKLGEGVDKAFRAVTIGVGLATAALSKFGVDAIKQASDLAESTNAVNVAFRDSARAVLAVGENSAESLGLAKSEFNAAAVRFSAFAERIVGEGGDVAGFIKDITTRAADFASVFNIEVSEALRVFQSGLSGEAEPLKRFGINLLESEVKAYALREGIIAVGQTMTEQQKVQARYGLLLESTAKTAGDFANTSDGLANSQRILKARFIDLQAEIGTALLPAVTNLVKAVADQLIPVFEDLGQFLNSPEGKKIIEDTAKAVGDFFEFIIKNIDTIADVAIKIGLFVTGLKFLKVALELATTAQLIFNTAVRANPYVIAATALIALAGGMALVADYAAKATEKGNKNAQSVAYIEEEIRRLREAYQDGLIPQDKYQKKLDELEGKLREAGGAAYATRGEINRFNNIRLDGLRNQLRDTAGELNRFRNIAASIAPKDDGEDDPIIDPKAEKASEKVQKFIKDAQKALAKAQSDYQETVAKAQKKYADAIEKTEESFANKLADIVRQSQDRLRSAYQAAVATNVASLFDAFKKEEAERKEAFDKATEDIKTAQEKLKEADEKLKETLADPKSTKREIDSATKAFETAKSEFERLNKIVEAGLTKENPVDVLVEELRAKLIASRQLLSNSAALASQGFSQTFIEQIVAAGTETGNELAGAILAATPETQAELRSLFLAIESEAESGMDSLARQIYEDAGLATTALKNLYEKTNEDLKTALKDLQQTFNDEVLEANKSLVEAVKEIRVAFTENIASMKGDLGGLGKVVEEFMRKLGKVETDAESRIEKITAPATTGATGGTAGALSGVNMAASAITDATGILIDSASDIGKVLAYLTERITAANEFANRAAIAGQTAAAMSAIESRNLFRSEQARLSGLGAAAVGTVININVKTDSTQSLAMVGKSLGNTITKYVSAGGQVLVSPTN